MIYIFVIQELETFYTDHFGGSATNDTQSSVNDTDDHEADTAVDQEWPDDDDQVERDTTRIEERIDTYLDGDDTVEDDANNSGNESPVSDGNGRRCSCKVDCVDQFDKETVSSHILGLKEMDKNEKEMYIMGSLQKVANEETRRGKRKRVRYLFRFEGKAVCRKLFCFIFDVGHKTLRGIQEHMNKNGIVPRVHGNAGKKPHHAIKYREVRHLVDFLIRYADLYGLPMPAAPRGRDEDPPIYLPSSLTKTELHKSYVAACQDTDTRALKITSYKDIWRHCVPHIRISSPKDDVCQKCEMTRKAIADAVSENDKLEAATTLRTHIEVIQYFTVCC